MPKRELTNSIIKNFTLDELLDVYIKKYLDNIDLSNDNSIVYSEFIKILEKSLIKNALEKSNNNKIKASKILGINRNSIHSKIKKLNIECKSRKFR